MSILILLFLVINSTYSILNETEVDESFYYSHYSDVKSNAIDHYINFGWKELRDPSPEFSTAYYLKNNIDVEQSQLNPFYHYLCFGKNENRISRCSLLSIPDFTTCSDHNLQD